VSRYSDRNASAVEALDVHDGGAYSRTMTRDAERAYVRNWVETARELEAFRWRELAALTDDEALRAADALLAAAVLVPLPPRRVVWSGLVDLQDLLHHRPS